MARTCMPSHAIGESARRPHCSAPAGHRRTWLWCAGCWSTARAGVVHLEAPLGHLQRHARAAHDIAETILNAGVPVDGGVRGARRPLQTFAHQADRRTVAWLIAHGADVNARTHGGRTAAHFAAERNTGP